MHFQFSPYIIPLLAAALISGWVMIYSWAHRRTAGAIALALLALAITEWSIGYALEIAGTDLATKVFFGKAQYAGIVLTPLMWLIFSFNQANHARILKHRAMVLLAVLPLVTFVMTLTTEAHGLVWKQISIYQSGNFSALQVSYGAWFWVHSAYSYILLLAGTVIVIRSIFRNKGLYRGQAASLLVAVVVPWLSNVLYLSGASPFPHFDPTPFAFTITTFALTWGIFGFRLIDLSPMARDSVIDEMHDGMVVFDTRNLVVDINPSAQVLLGKSAAQAIGQPAEEVFTRWPNLIERYRNVSESLDEVAYGDGEQSWYELRLSPLHDRGKRLIGRVIVVRDITERKKAENRIAQLSRAVEASPASIVITDLQGYIQYVNPKFTQVTGYSLQEAVGQNPRILKSDQTQPGVHLDMWQTILAGQEWHGEFCNRKKNGDLYWESASISPVMDSAGKMVNFIAVKEDITEQRRVREQLRQRNEYLSILHQITLDLLNHRDYESLLQATIDRAAALLNASFGEIYIQDGDDLVVRSVTQNLSTLAGERVEYDPSIPSWQAFATGEPVILNDYSSAPARQSKYQDIGLQAIANFPVMTGGKCIAVLALGRTQPNTPYPAEQVQIGLLLARLVALVLDNANLYDSALQEIAERKRAESLLQESEARYRQIVENASDIIFRADVQGNFTYVNPSALRLMGFRNESEMVGKKYLEFTAPDWKDKLERFYRRQLVKGETSTYFEFAGSAANGDPIWLGQNVQLIKEGDQVVGFQAVARDITQRKRVEEALLIARDQALEANRLKSQLVAKVSHELRTPLGGIIGFAELLHEDTFGPLTESQKEATGQIIESAHYLNIMVNELLDQAQIEAKTVILRMGWFSPAAMLQRVAGNMAVLSRTKGLDFNTGIAADLPVEIYGDEHRLQEILINLTSNAIKFTKKGWVQVQLLRPDPSHWAIKVVDSGAGIPMESQATIFEPFHQVDNAITHENRGTGLGLSITKQLVELMGGCINLESKVGQGSCFMVELPIVNAQGKNI